MQVTKTDELWRVEIEDSDNQLGLINTIRHLDRLNDELSDVKIEGLIFEIDLEKLRSANSELIAQFVMIQTSLVRMDGRLRIVNANPELKSSFDVVMLDKIINISYPGQNAGGSEEE